MTSTSDSFALRLRSLLESSPPDSPDWTARFSELARELFALQFEHVAPYRRFCERRGVRPETLAHWTDIPAVPSAAFKEFDLTSLPAAARLRVFHSSGTTGQSPSRHYHSAESLALYESALLAGFNRDFLPGLELPVSMLCLTPAPEHVPHSSLVHMFRVVMARFGTPTSSFLARTVPDAGWVLDLPGLDAALTLAIEVGQPIVLLGTAFSYVHWLEALAARGQRLRLPQGSRALETGGYKGRSRSLSRAELHHALATQLGLDPALIVSEFGMSELGSQAYDTTAGAQPTPPASRRFRFPGWARARVISPDHGREVPEGDTGLLHVFDLANVWSVQAIQTGDLAVRRGDGFELAGRVPVLEPRGCSLLPAADLAPAPDLLPQP